MELKAIYTALKCISYKNLKIDIYADSEYALNTSSKWIFDWSPTEFAGKANKDILKLLYKELKLFKNLNFFHVKGHSGQYYNEMADKLASFNPNEKIEIDEKL